MAKIARKFMAHFIDVDFTYQSVSASPDWYWLGDDLGEYSVELNPRVEIVRNLLDEEIVYHDGYEPSAESDSFYARTGDKLFNRLQSIIDNLPTGDDCITYMLDVHMWDDVYLEVEPQPSDNPKQKGWYIRSGGKYVPATDTAPITGTDYYMHGYKSTQQAALVIPESYGGDTSGYQIPFSIRYINDKVKGTFVPDGNASGVFYPND